MYMYIGPNLQTAILLHCINIMMPYCTIMANIPVLVLPELINDNRNIPPLVNASIKMQMYATYPTASKLVVDHNKVIIYSQKDTR